MQASFYWFDYETFGRHPGRDRAAQFAGIRTNENLEVIGEPLVIYCQLADDYLPDPEACMITGISPNTVNQQGIPEAEFIAAIHAQLSQPGTCSVGYNNIRFDDEFTRNLLYRNFFDPYQHEWKNGNSRWDLLDLVRLTRALRPDGIEWPVHADGTPSNKLEDLCKANNISHEHAHDALSDVYATIALARLIRDKKFKLYNYIFNHRDKHSLGGLLNLRVHETVFHVSGMIPGIHMNSTLIVPIARHPHNNNGVLVYDLRNDPTQFAELSIEQIQRRLFSKKDELAENETRIPVKTVHLNKCPIIVPLNTLDPHSAKQLNLDIEQADLYKKKLLAMPRLIEKIRTAFDNQTFDTIKDPDEALYSGGFFNSNDRQAMDIIRKTKPEQLAELDLFYVDQRVPELLFRYRARNYPQTLSNNEQQQWDEFRELHYCRNDENSIENYLENLQLLAENRPDQTDLLEELKQYAKNTFSFMST